MNAKQEVIKRNNIIICMIDEFQTGVKDAWDCHVLYTNERGAQVIYLAGYRSRDQFVEWSDIVAKLDKRRRKVTVEGTFTGNFLVFEDEHEKEI
jgi:hypothetical protein